MVSSASLIRYSQDVVYLVHQKSLVNQDGMGMGSYNFIAVNGNIFVVALLILAIKLFSKIF